MVSQRARTSPIVSAATSAARLPTGPGSCAACRGNESTTWISGYHCAHDVLPADSVRTNRCTIPAAQPFVSASALTWIMFDTSTNVVFGKLFATRRAPWADVTESRSPTRTSVGTFG